MKRFRLLSLVAIPAIIWAACENTPSAPIQSPQSFVTIPTPAVENAVACKAYTGTVATGDFQFTGTNLGASVGSPFTIAAESCRVLRIKGADTIRVSATEINIPTGVQLDSVVVYQFESGVGTTHTNLGAVTTGSVYAGGNPASGGVIVFYNSDTPTEVPGDQGCTPGYWKNHVSSWTGYTTGQTAGSVFTLTGFPTLAGKTLKATLEGGGGPGTLGSAQILLRAAVAALLDASHSGVNYPRTTADIISDVNAALASNNRNTMLTLAEELDADNNLGCPLN